MLFKSLFLCLFAILWFFVQVPSVSAATTYDMSNTSNWNIRFDGAVLSDGLNVTKSTFADINNDGKKDLIFAANSDYNSRSNSGSVYIISYDLLQSLTGKGNTIDLSDTTKFSLRIDGAAASDSIGNSRVLTPEDLDGDGKNDLIIGGDCDNNSRTNSGCVYVIYNSILAANMGTGNTLDLATSTSYNLRFDGALASHFLGCSNTNNFLDIDGDGGKDLLLPACTTSFNSRSNSGSLYLIYNSLLQTYSGTGNNIDLSSSSTYNVRFDGAVASDSFGTTSRAAIIDGDSQADILSAVRATDYNSRASSGSLYVILYTSFSGLSGTGNTVDMSSSSSFSLRIDGATAGDQINEVTAGDINGNGATDLAVGAFGADFNSRNASGTVYVIYDSLLTLSGTGNTMDLATSSSYNLRVDGAIALDSLPDNNSLRSLDVDADGKSDVLFGASFNDPNSLVNAGSLYVILASYISSLSGTGNNLDLNSGTSFGLRFIGVAASDFFGVGNFNDLNSDGSIDFVVSATGADYNSRSASGSIYITYNFPHTITANSFSTTSSSSPTVDGSVNVSTSSITSLSGVQFNVDGGSETSSWTNCSLQSSTFICQPSGLSSGSHRIYIRAYDSNTFYTSQSNYGSFTFTVGPTSGGGGGSDPNQLPNWSEPITVGPNRIGAVGTNGFLSLSGDINNPGIGAFFPPNVSTIDLYINPTVTSFDYLASLEIPFPWSQGLNIYSNIYDFRAVSSFNGYPVLTSNLPYTIVLSYNPEITINPKLLRIAFFNSVTNKWQILPGPYIINYLSHTIATTTTQFSFFAIVRKL